MKRLCILGLLPVLLWTGCSPYERVNPLDPGFGLEVSLVGPDSVFSLNDTIQFRVVTDPDIRGLDFVWASSDSVRLPPLAGQPGTFATLANGAVSVTAELGPHRVQRTVVIQQRATGLRIDGVEVSELQSLGEQVTLSTSIVDARGTPVPGASGTVIWSSSQPAIAEVAAGRVTARSNGSAWIRATSGSLVDSVRMVVRQRPVTMQFGSASYSIGIPGGTVQTVLNIRDARNNPISSPAGLSVVSSRPTFNVDAGGLVRSSGYGSTEIIARLGELEARTQVRVTGGTAPVVASSFAGLTRIDREPARDFVVLDLEARDAEFDLDEATIELYSAANTWIRTRVFSLEQGLAVFPLVVGMTRAPEAGSVRSRLRDSAGNQSPFTFTPVGSHPVEEAPSAQLTGAVRNADGSLSLTFSVTPGRPLPGMESATPLVAYAFGFSAAGEVEFSRRRNLSSWNGFESLSWVIQDASASRVAYVGVLVRDSAGNISVVATRDLLAGASVSPSIRQSSVPGRHGAAVLSDLR